MTEKFSLTQKQAKVYEFIKRFIETNKYPPSYDEIGEGMDCTREAAFFMLKRIEERGWIKRKPGKYRSITLT